jgi:hypothetical protein
MVPSAAERTIEKKETAMKRTRFYVASVMASLALAVGFFSTPTRAIEDGQTPPSTSQESTSGVTAPPQGENADPELWQTIGLGDTPYLSLKDVAVGDTVCRIFVTPAGWHAETLVIHQIISFVPKTEGAVFPFEPEERILLVEWLDRSTGQLEARPDITYSGDMGLTGLRTYEVRTYPESCEWMGFGSD